MGPPRPLSTWRALGTETGRLTPQRVDEEPIIEALKRRFGIAQGLFIVYRHPYVYLDREVIAGRGLSLEETELALATELMKIDGIAAAVPSSELLKGDLPDTP